MFTADYHLHSMFSFDGHDTIEHICETAIQKGLDEIVVTDHMDLYSNKPYAYILDCPALYAELKRCQALFQDCLTVRTGIEYGQPMVNPSQAQKFLQDYPDLDFIIGSVHNMENDIDVGEYDFTRCDPYTVYDHYLDWLILFAENYDYDVIGHITYPLRYMAEAGITLNLSAFLFKIRHLYSIIIERGKGIELNVSGYRQALKEPMPNAMLLHLYRECGGRILTIGSDAHYCCDVGSHIRQGQALAKAEGFSQITRFEKRVPIFIDI